MADLASKTVKAINTLKTRSGSMPKIEEVAEYLNVEPRELEELNNMSAPIISLEMPVNNNQDVVVKDLIADSGHSNVPEQLAINKDKRKSIFKVLNTLEPREKEIIIQRFGLNGDNPKSLEEIGKVIGLTKERVR